MNFRRCILALAVLSLFVGLASAQVNNSGAGTGPSVQCVANVAVPPQLRSEGLTELIGDIVIICSGGTAPAPGSPIQTANITVSLGTNVTSRLLTNSLASNASEAVLIIDEANTAGQPGVSGVGPTLPFNVCPTPNLGAGPGGCSQIVSTASPGAAGPAAGQAATSCTTVSGVTSCTAAYNVFQGLVNANQVTFLGVPVLPPTTAGTARYYRITNVRANVAGLGINPQAGIGQVVASVSISGSTSLPVSNPTLVAGFTQLGLSTSLRNTANSGSGGNTSLAQCGGGGPTSLTVLRFSETFGTAFKTRVAPTSAYNGQSSTPTQNVPGLIYNSESGLVLSVNGGTAGLADYGTRLKATFNNIPTGVRLFVSTSNVANDFAALPVQPPGNATTSYAQMVSSETFPDGNGTIPGVLGNTNITFGSTTLSIIELPVVNNSATAVWEVLNTNPNALDTLDFGVYQQFTANPGANSPPVGTATVTMTYAPTFVPPAGTTASSTLTIPRFVDPNSAATNILNITLCQTVLLYPYVTNIAGFDTGLAIANTTTDPFGTRAQNGACRLNFYGSSAPPPVSTPNVPTGTVYTTLASTAAPGFNGYMIAVCDFQLAHGFAFISDLGARNLAMGYLALILPDGTGSRNNRTEQLNN